MATKIFSLKNLGYLAYAIALLAVLAYIRFPAEKFKEYVEKTVDRKIPGRECTIGEIRYTFPAGLTLLDLSLVNEESELMPLLISRLEFSSLLWKKWRGVEFEGLIGGGSFNGTATFDTGKKNFSVDEFTAEEIDCGEVVPAFIDREMTGVLQLSMKYQADLASPLDGRGQGNISVTDGEIEFMTPVFSLEQLDFREISANFELGNSLLKLLRGKVREEIYLPSFRDR